MEAIASEAKVTPAAIYNHFASKEQLFTATAVHMAQINLEAIRAEIDAATASRNGWKSALASVLRLIAEDATGWLRFPLLISAVQLKMLHNREQFAEMLDLRREYVLQFERIIAASIAEGDLPETMPHAMSAQLLMAFIFNGMGAVMSHRQDEGDIRAIVDATAMLLGVADNSPTIR